MAAGAAIFVYFFLELFLGFEALLSALIFSAIALHSGWQAFAGHSTQREHFFNPKRPRSLHISFFILLLFLCS
jgi:hypothetical protein